VPVKVASEWLNSCSGCEIAILNLGEVLLTVLPHLDFVHIPVLMDHKYFGQTGEGDIHHLEIPEAVVGLVSGGAHETGRLHEDQASHRLGGIGDRGGYEVAGGPSLLVLCARLLGCRSDAR